MSNSVEVLPMGDYGTQELEEPKYVDRLDVQGKNLYKLHVGGEEAVDLFPLDTDIDRSGKATPKAFLHSRPDSVLEDAEPGLHSRLDVVEEPSPGPSPKTMSGKGKIKFANFGKVAPQMNELLGDGNHSVHARARRGAVSGHSTNTILNKDGTFITNVDSDFKMEVEVAKSVLVVDKRTVDEKVKAVVGDLKFPPGFKKSGRSASRGGQSELDKRLVGMPGGLTLSKSDTSKYFGTESRAKFFQRAGFIKNQRVIASVDAEHVTDKLIFDGETAGGNLNSAPTADLYHDGTHGPLINELAAEIPFYPMRVDGSVKVNTKIIIRTQTLDATNEAFTQLKLISKPPGYDESLDEPIEEEEGEPRTPPPERTVITDPDAEQEGLEAAQHPQFKHASDAYTTSISRIDETMRSIHQKSRPLVSPLHSTSASALVVRKPFSLLDPITPRPSTAEKAEKAAAASAAAATTAAAASKPMHRRASKAHSVGSNKTAETAGKSKKGQISLTPIGKTPSGGKRRGPSSTTDSFASSTSRESPVTVVEEGRDLSTTPPPPSSSSQTVQLEPLPLIGANTPPRDLHHSIHSKEEPLQFLCIDHRDNTSRRAKRNGANALYKYVSAKQRKYDFNDVGGKDGGDSDEEDLNRLKEMSKHHTKQKRPEDAAAAATDPAGAVEEENLPLSPRSHYIDSCIRHRLNPRASLILRKKFTKQLSLQHHGIGDEMMCLFAEAIVNIPYIQSLNIADNNLTDKSLGPIVLAVVKMKDLIDFNMSFNTIGPVAASSLAQYLSDPDCPLERLVLRRADIDDGECERFVSALKTNMHLKELDMSENLIGISENLNSVMPDIVTGGEALAALLRSGGCVISSLKLGWNMLRLDGAADFCNSLKTNATLTYLDLSFNSLGGVGGIALGDALQDNKTLKTLIISNNSLDSMACLTVCAGILENEELNFVSFDGNPIGEVGARALMLLPTMVGSRVRLSAAACNIGIKDPRCWFDSTQLLRKFELKLDDPFNRAIALFVMCLIAAHQTYFIAHSEWYDTETKTTTVLGLSEHVVVDFENARLDAEQRALIDSLRVVRQAASNITKALELFREIDEDGSGQLDHKEFGHLMECMGMELGPGRVEEIMAEYDVDGGGFIELPEFLMFLKNQLKEATVRLKELSEFPVMARAAEEGQPREKYLPPRHGILRLSVLDGFTQKPTYRVINGSDKDYILDVARQSGELLKMTHFGVQSYKIRFAEGLSLTETLLRESNNKTHVLAKVLPQIAKPVDARLLVTKVLEGNKNEIGRLKREIGNCIRPMLGNSDGYYILDLSNAMDKICLQKLLEIGMTTAYVRGKQRNKLGFGVLGDCSQTGNWSAFRNELFNGKPITMTTEFATPMPRTGRLEFDFVSERRIEKDVFVLNDVRFTNMLVKYCLLLPSEREDALARLAKQKKASDTTLNGDARTVYETPLDKAQEISTHMAAFYGDLASRSTQVEKYRQKEGIKVKMEHDPNHVKVNVTNIRKYYNIPSMAVPRLWNPPHQKGKKRVPLSGRPVLAINPNAPPTNGKPSAGVTPGGSAAARNVATPKTGRSATASSTAVAAAAAAATANNPTTPKTSRPNTGRADPFPEPSESQDDEEDDDEDEDNGGGGDDRTEGHGDEDVHDVNEDSESSDDDSKSPKKRSTEVHTDATVNGLNFPRHPITMQDVSQMETVMHRFQEATELDEQMNRYVCTMGSMNVQAQSKACRQLELMVDLFEFQFLMCRHLELLLDLYRDLGSNRTSDLFGTYRVELVVTLFACVVDIHNFEIVLRSLTAFEVACVYCRLGWLHLYNPMKPEGAFELDLSRREERQILKTLTQLATAEPGDNLPYLSFRWERDMAPMPGYELTEPWMTEEGLPKKGIWTAIYYSGEGSCKKGCKPYVKLRRSMLQMVFVDEADVVNEADRDSDTPPPLQGEAFMLANTNMWYGYLAYNEEEYKAMKSKKAADAAAAAKLAKKMNRK